MIIPVVTFEDDLNEWWFEYEQYNQVEIEGVGRVWRNFFDYLESNTVSDFIYVVPDSTSA